MCQPESFKPICVEVLIHGRMGTKMVNACQHNFTALEFRGMPSLKSLVQKELKKGMGRRKLANAIGVSHGTIGNILNDDLPKKMNTLQCFAEYFHTPVATFDDIHGISSAMEDVAPYKVTPLPVSIKELVELAKQLDHDELSTLKRCAAAFTRSTPDVRQHLIGQLKIIERLVEHETSSTAGRDPTHQKKMGSS